MRGGGKGLPHTVGWVCAGKLLQFMSWRTFEDMCQLSCSIEGSLGHSWGSLGRSWALLGRSWGTLVASWGALGALLTPLGALLGRLGALLRRSWMHLGPSWMHLGENIEKTSRGIHFLKPLWDPKWRSK